MDVDTSPDMTARTRADTLKAVKPKDAEFVSFPATAGKRHTVDTRTNPAQLESEMIRVAIVDDHPLARRGLAEILTETGEFVVTCATAFPADVGPDADPDVVLLDLYSSGDQPCLTDITHIKSFSKVLVVSASGRPADVVGAIQAGADGYVTKLADPEMLVSAVKTVAGGGFALFAQLADILQAELAGTGRPAVGAQEVRLSPREEQTLDLIAQGFTHAQTATRLGVTKATVDTYVERIRKKLQVGNKAELTRAALERLKGP